MGISDGYDFFEEAPQPSSLVPKTLDDARKLVSTPPPEDESSDVASYVIDVDAEGIDFDTYQIYLAKTNLVSFNTYVSSETQIFWTNLLTDILEDTGSPALELQAINTAGSPAIYENGIGSFTVECARATGPLLTLPSPLTMSGFTIACAPMSVTHV